MLKILGGVNLTNIIIGTKESKMKMEKMSIPTTDKKCSLNAEKQQDKLLKRENQP